MMSLSLRTLGRASAAGLAAGLGLEMPIVAIPPAVT